MSATWLCVVPSTSVNSTSMLAKAASHVMVCVEPTAQVSPEAGERTLGVGSLSAVKVSVSWETGAVGAAEVHDGHDAGADTSTQCRVSVGDAM
eukprot:CAMPEP_0175895444 /NCGR_PEP_ID=MMETSP0107_2-20121207/50518_1 /TAXON_ID=195067 ORGANISM="Goniomonas pacifica, Strain CCMP1869" /NCGR_SAMPLE_ID=MMETSP0107_2 /ASSEMBLY_ACC=CAM_ASM_000203 /LENGTH=92 /DNA_ID=CAMNT_0017216583 /DNA_START=167 /DNA_END=446 /DNA_ORIENTATION=+